MKNKICKICSKKYEVLPNHRQFQNWCSHDCAVAMTIDKQKKTAARKKIKEQHRKEKKDFQELKESFKTAGQYVKEAQFVVNNYVRFRDQEKLCISCEKKPMYKVVNAGHYRSIGAASHLRFNLFNIHGQCFSCNVFESGNIVNYRINLVEKIGLEKVESLETDNTPRKFTIDYLKRIKKVFSRRLKHLQKLRKDNK
jgi:hypothetical protein